MTFARQSFEHNGRSLFLPPAANIAFVCGWMCGYRRKNPRAFLALCASKLEQLVSARLLERVEFRAGRYLDLCKARAYGKKLLQELSVRCDYRLPPTMGSILNQLDQVTTARSGRANAIISSSHRYKRSLGHTHLLSALRKTGMAQELYYVGNNLLLQSRAI